MESNEKKIFETQSAIKGLVVKLTQKKFDEHIIAGHPEMIGHEKDIEKTIKKPDIVRKAKVKPDVRLEFIRKTNFNEISEYNNVMVEYNDKTKSNAHVVTSFYSDDIGKGGGEIVYFAFNHNI